MTAPCVLVVEDEPLIRDLLVAELCDAGYLVIAVADAREAGEACRDYQIDIVFIDIRRPGAAEGWTLAERLRERQPQCPVVCASTGQPSRPVPCAEVLRRPFSMAEALTAIAAALKSHVTSGGDAASPSSGAADGRRIAGCTPQESRAF